MNKMMTLGATVALAFASSAMAEFEIAWEVSGLDPDSANVWVEENNAYAGRNMLRVGYRDMVIENASGAMTNDFQAGWAMDLSIPGYGIGFFTLAAPVPMAFGENALNDVEYDVSVYSALVAPEDYWFGGYNTGAGVFGTEFTVTSGTFYIVVEGEEIPAPGALALLGLAGLATRRRRA